MCAPKARNISLGRMADQGRGGSAAEQAQLAAMVARFRQQARR
jgi:hypothetical protein